MYRLSTSIPRLAACAVCLTSAVVVQRKGRPKPVQDPHHSSACRPARAAGALAPAAAATAAAAVSTTPAWPTAAQGLGSMSTALVRTLISLARSMWWSVAIGAAASLATVAATVNAKVVASLKQLQLAAPAQAKQQPALDVGTVEQFCGQWTKVQQQSGSMDSFCELFGVPRWLRQATRLMTGMQISITDDTLVIKQVCKLGWLSAVETFPLDGSCSKPHKRRDMRSGKQTGQLLEAQDGRMVVSVCWQGSLAGSAADTLLLQQTPQGGMQLVVLHKAQVHGRGTAEFKEVFRMDV